MAIPRRARIETITERASVTPLELFYDLVFVFALTRVTDWMADEPTVTNVVRGILILTVMWWSWVGYAWAGVSVDYVVRLEQGRGLRPSPDVLDALARALRLSDDERAYLFDLAQQRPASRRRTASQAGPITQLVRNCHHFQPYCSTIVSTSLPGIPRWLG